MLFASLALAAGIIGVLTAWFATGKSWSFQQPSHAELSRGLTRPLRLELAEPRHFQELLLGLRTFHYRAQPNGVEMCFDVLYDTQDFQLFRHGYFYRFRQRKREDGTADYSIGLHREQRSSPDGLKKIELESTVPASLGAAIAQGAWGKALDEGEGLDLVAQLRALRRELNIAQEEFHPRLAAELRRERFDITDKGQNWFRLDHEIWSFHLVGGPHRRVEFEDAVIDTRLKKGDPELIRRVSTIRRLSTMIHGVRASDLAPHERAMTNLLPGAGH